MVFRGEPQPLPTSVADALRVASDHMEEAGDDRCRLLRELANGFACHGGKTDQWEVTVAKFHTSMVTHLCNTIAHDVIDGLAREIQAVLDATLTNWFVRRDSGSTRATKSDFVYRFEIFLVTRNLPVLNDWIERLGEKATIEFIDQTIGDQFEPAIQKSIACPFKAKRGGPTILRQPDFSSSYHATAVWELRLPKEPVVEHLGFSITDLA